MPIVPDYPRTKYTHGNWMMQAHLGFSRC
jgi:hypothetical protein